MNRLAASSTFCIACSGVFAQGPFIEVAFEAVQEGASDETLARFSGRYVFDASAAPVPPVEPFGVCFESVQGSATTVTFSDATALANPLQSGPQPVTATLMYIELLDRWEVSAELNGGTDTAALLITPPVGGFSLAMTSLPDDPADWLPDTSVAHAASAATTSGQVFWTSSGGFSNGTFSYWVREVPDPNAADCAADCNGDGTLNVDDIDCFVDSFLSGCP